MPERPENSKIAKQISEIEPIQKSPKMIRERNELSSYVEAPLLKPCQILYDRNIQTLYSGANKHNIERGDPAYIGLEPNGLSSNNLEIALEIGNKLQDIIRIEIPISKDTSEDEISRAMTELVERFEIQPLSWALMHDGESFDRMVADAQKRGTEITKPELISQFVSEGAYYSEEEDKLFRSEELYQKYREAKNLEQKSESH